MSNKRAAIFWSLACAGLLILAVKGVEARIRQEERSVRKKVLDQLGLDIVAIHQATDVINSQIESGKIRDWATLEKRVHEEVAFQKIAIREETEA